MSDLIETGQAMINPLFNLWNNFVEILPGLIAAIVLLVVGYFLASLLGYVLEKVLEKFGLDKSIAPNIVAHHSVNEQERPILRGTHSFFKRGHIFKSSFYSTKMYRHFTYLCTCPNPA